MHHIQIWVLCMRYATCHMHTNRPISLYKWYWFYRDVATSTKAIVLNLLVLFPFLSPNFFLFQHPMNSFELIEVIPLLTKAHINQLAVHSELFNGATRRYFRKCLYKYIHVDTVFYQHFIMYYWLHIFMHIYETQCFYCLSFS